MNSGVNILGKRLYSTNLADVAVLESVQSHFYFHIFDYNVFPAKLQANV